MGCSIVEPSVQVLVHTPVVCVHFSGQTNTSFYFRVQSCSISTCDNFEIPSIRSVFCCHNTKDPNVPLCSSSTVVLRKIIHHNMSRWSILPFTLTEIVCIRSTRQRKQPSKFYKFFLVFIDVFINNYDIVDLFWH